VENLWSAYGAYRTLNKPWLAIGFAAIGVHQMLDAKMLTPHARPSSMHFQRKRWPTAKAAAGELGQPRARPALP
jgi:hypothetical protein